MNEEIDRLLHSRGQAPPPLLRKGESEGGCGVIGVASQKKIPGKHLLAPLIQMKNRGNGKGGGIAAAGFHPETFGVSQEVLHTHYLLAIAYLDPSVQAQLYEEFITPLFEVEHIHTLPQMNAVPLAILYFVRVKKEQIERYRFQNTLPFVTDETIQDELVYQNSYRLNSRFYASIGEKKAFVLSHGKNLLVLKCVGYADEVVKNYRMEEIEAHLWIGHHRYPTKGKVWHPGGAHPFIGMHEALVHNGDFANYSALCEYLAQRNIHPLFLTDTEVSVLLFDLLSRTYKYPLEYVLEALAPTTERDFFKLPKAKREIYDVIQKTHLHASPDGPWFFIVAQSHMPMLRLIGITDTSMLRPQVFALQSGLNSIGLIASEKQAIDAYLLSLSEEDKTFWPRADTYWSCRGGSHTDGGAFIFSVQLQKNGEASFSCTDKFGKPTSLKPESPPPQWGKVASVPSMGHIPDLPPAELFGWVKEKAPAWNYEETFTFLKELQKNVESDNDKERIFSILTRLLDHIIPLQNMRRSYFLSLVDHTIATLITQNHKKMVNHTLVLDASSYEAQGEGSLANALIHAYKEGVKKILVGNCKGHRFLANGLGPSSLGVEIDVYGSSGDYLASGIDGAHINVHGSAQDQVGQIMKSGKLVIFGDVGQTLLYGAKGGATFVRGSAAGRSLINAVGNVKLIINGTALDYLAESFMAGDPLGGGGFAILNRIAFNESGILIDLDPPFPGGNLFSLGSGGAIYIRDPEHVIGPDQFNGAQFTHLTPLDQNLIAPYLEENARLFGIPLSRLLEFNGRKLTFEETYRKIIPAPTHFINPEKAWVNIGKSRTPKL